MCLKIIKLLMKFKFSNTYCKHAKIIFILSFKLLRLLSILFSRSSDSLRVKTCSTFAPNLLAVLQRAVLGGCSETGRTNVVRQLITKQTLLISQRTTLV